MPRPVNAAAVKKLAAAKPCPVCYAEMVWVDNRYECVKHGPAVKA